MTDITIPPEALKAMRAELPPFFSESMAHAACLAMLKAWPGMEYMMGDEAFPFHYIILPITEKQSD